MRTHTPQLDDEVLERLLNYCRLFSCALRRKGYLDYAHAYLIGLLQDGDRKSVEPLVNRIRWLPACQGDDPVQAIWHFVSKGKWSDDELLATYRDVLRKQSDGPDAAFIFDDTSFVKKGDHSVGVTHQYCGSLGKRANCQVAVSLHYATPAGHYPLSMRLYLPSTWTSDPQRLEKALVPVEHREHRTKHEIALDLLDQALGEGHTGRFVLADAAYGNSAELRAALEARGLTYAVGIQAESVAFTAPPKWLLPGEPGVAPNQIHPKLAPGNPLPQQVQAIADQLPLRTCVWRDGTKGKLRGQFAATRVWPAKDWQSGLCAKTGSVWLVVEKRGDERRYYFCNAADSASLVSLIRLLKRRWPVEQGYQQLKEELGLDHFEGRSWIGLHHHICLTFLAYGFLELERRRLARTQKRRDTAKKSPLRSLRSLELDEQFSESL